ncbi:hypothetical protein DK847_12885 [Aestuariivirga litoralis]|uniref:Uncharacterized protein n=1 Tax=Aestuariivirga litoralis TaxID=2650924 RepID=A0A2W2AMS2_9HYPH|nr:hypothetical protein [Aestuariivirga litoralis]PZF76681.1 hypothetical protein DK847_12885 [Aestuariivirga litoralis]
MKSTLALSLGLAVILGLGAALPVSAATTTATSAAAAKPTHYYVSLKAKGPGCEVVAMKPTTKLMVGKHSFKTEADASKAMAGDKACKA